MHVGKMFIKKTEVFRTGGYPIEIRGISRKNESHATDIAKNAKH